MAATPEKKDDGRSIELIPNFEALKYMSVFEPLSAATAKSWSVLRPQIDGFATTRGYDVGGPINVTAHITFVDSVLKIMVPLFADAIKSIIRSHPKMMETPLGEIKQEGKKENWLYNMFYQGFSGFDLHFCLRPVLTRDVCWAIPGADTVTTIMNFVENKKIADLGAGRGYWAYLFHKAGADVVAIDLPEEERSCYTKPHIAAVSKRLTWFPIQVSNYQDYVATPDAQDRCLFFSWPRYTPTLSVLRRWQGSTIVTVAEREGATGDFGGYLEKTLEETPHHNFILCSTLECEVCWCRKWKTTEFRLPVWSGIHDTVIVFSSESPPKAP